MTEESYRRLSIEEIVSKINRRRFDLGELIEESLQAGTTFFFGVDKLETGFRISINGGGLSTLYLVPSVNDRRALFPAIIPSNERVGTDEHHGSLEVIFYVLLSEHDQFRQEAYEVFTLYHYQGRCFRAIPDIWFKKMMLIQFIREKVLPHSVLLEVFRDFDGMGAFWYSSMFEV